MISQNNHEIIDGLIHIDATNYSYKNSSYVQAYSVVPNPVFSVYTHLQKN